MPNETLIDHDQRLKNQPKTVFQRVPTHTADDFFYHDYPRTHAGSINRRQFQAPKQDAPGMVAMQPSQALSKPSRISHQTNIKASITPRIGRSE